MTTPWMISMVTPTVMMPTAMKATISMAIVLPWHQSIHPVHRCWMCSAIVVIVRLLWAGMATSCEPLMVAKPGIKPWIAWITVMAGICMTMPLPKAETIAM